MQKQKSKKKAVASSAPLLRAIFASATPLAVAPSAEDQVYAGYSCNNCSATFAMNQLVAGEAEGDQETIQPMCPDCGSENVEATGDATDTEILDDADASAFSCRTCGTQMAFSSKTHADFNGVANCVVCGTANTLEDEEDLDGEDVDVDSDLDLDLEDSELEDDQEEAAEFNPDQDEEQEDSDSDQEEAGDDDLPVVDGDAPPADADNDEDSAEEEAEEEAADDVDGGNLEGAPDEEQVEATEEDQEDLDLLDAVDSNDEELTASFVRIGDRIVAFAGDITVGVQRRNDVVASRQEMFDSQEYLKALASAARTRGMGSTLSDFGFNRTSIKVNANRIAALSEDRVAERASVIASSQATTYASELQSCLGIASVGINKKFFPGIENKIKTSLVASLKSVGFKNPERHIDQAFAAHADDYHRELLAQALELMSQPVEVRNAISKAVSGVPYSSGFVQASDEVDEDEDLENEVENAHVHVAHPVRGTATATDYTQDRPRRNNGVSEVIASLKEKTGGSLF